VMRLTMRRGDATPRPAPSQASPPSVPTVSRPPPAEERARRPPSGKLRMLTSPSNAEILIDGRRIGVGSAVDLRLAVGERLLEVRAPGYKSFDTTLVVKADSTLALGRIILAEGNRRP
jgi:PEGA domain